MVVGGTEIEATKLRRAVAAEPLLAEVMPRLTFRAAPRTGAPDTGVVPRSRNRVRP
jgi:hypothetical protein